MRSGVEAAHLRLSVLHTSPMRNGVISDVCIIETCLLHLCGNERKRSEEVGPAPCPAPSVSCRGNMSAAAGGETAEQRAGGGFGENIEGCHHVSKCALCSLWKSAYDGAAEITPIGEIKMHRAQLACMPAPVGDRRISPSVALQISRAVNQSLPRSGIAPFFLHFGSVINYCFCGLGSEAKPKRFLWREMQKRNVANFVAGARFNQRHMQNLVRACIEAVAW